MSSGSRYYLNPLFDLQIGGYPTKSVERSAAEMSLLFLPLLNRGDTFVADVEFRESFCTYLKRSGALYPEFLHETGTILSSHQNEVVWGWNAEAAARLGCRLTPELARKLAVTANVNNRLFCNECSRRFGTGVPGSVFCRHPSEFTAALASLSPSYPLVVKPAFGGSGFGIRVIDRGEDAGTMVPAVEEYCRHGGCVVEPWYKRVADVSSCINIAEDGTLDEPMFHTQWVNRHGSFYGIVIDDQDPVIATWRLPLLQMTRDYAEAAAEKGYRGYLGIDSFVYVDSDEQEKLAAGIEINGRFTMGILAQLLRKKLSPQKKLLFRFIGKKRYSLPADCIEIEEQFGHNAYDKTTGEGILLLTPPEVRWCGTWAKPQRYAFALFADSTEKLVELDSFVRNSDTLHTSCLSGF